MNHDVKDLINPVFNSLCLSVCYLPEIRSSVSNTLFNLVTGKSLYSFRNTSSRDQILGHIAHMMMSYRVGPEIPLRLHGVTNPSLDPHKTIDTFGDTCSAPLQSPSYVVTFDTPKALLRYPGVIRSHGQRKRYLTFAKLQQMNYSIFCASLRIGSCPSHHSPNDVIPLSMTSNVHSQETMTIC